MYRNPCILRSLRTPNGGSRREATAYSTVLVLESYGPNFTCYIRVFSTIQYAPVHRTKKALMAPRRGRARAAGEYSYEYPYEYPVNR